MITLRRSEARGQFNHGWLDTKHTFSFAQYHDPKYNGFRSLRVINEDRVSGGAGFGTHGHRDMEIITYPINGSLEHKDSLGNGSVIKPGDVQRMSAGTGIQHSEFNHSKTESVHFLQIWIFPEVNGLSPSYEQRYFSPEEKQGKLCLVGSRDGRDNSVIIHQDVSLYACVLRPGESVNYQLNPHRYVWLQVVKGGLLFNDQLLESGDGVAVSDSALLTMVSDGGSEFLLFDLS